ncbi:non-hydrolyzing UDP-N-acetylglucosamine 2-epimerase [Acetohalobium arabaticum]|uniref:non-hydrolyzing UDP-N-acetylglucosamine 2-epimerase n=1 Tax=Acetohalobium arabaticum TaxID=28187 RepID=UPI000305D315
MEEIKKVAIIFGTRPEAIKMAPVVKELKQSQNLNPVVITTAQHRELLDQVLELFQLEVDYDLDIMKPKQNLSQITIKILQQLKPLFEQEEPDLVLVHGDTTTTFTSSLAAFYAQIPIGHVEAGLRTYEKYDPFPEEMNRRLCGVLTEMHFAPTEQAKNNLLQEGIDESQVFITGNTIVDALLEIYEKDYRFSKGVINDLDLLKEKLILVTTHRRENLGQPLVNICRAIKELVVSYPQAEVVFPVHPNPKISKIVKNVLSDVPNVHLIEPLNYKEFINLMVRADIILTDSGGIQEEASSLGKPTLLLRETTERPEAIVSGSVQLVGTNKTRIVKAGLNLLHEQPITSSSSVVTDLYGDGQAAVRIRELLITYFNNINK